MRAQLRGKMTITILDGGMGGELQARLPGAGRGLWSARALVDAPDIVVGLHKEYIDAGARVIITNTYSTIPSYLGKENLAGQYEAMTALGGQLARRAADESGQSVTVAGSLPPLSESYRADLVPAHEVAAPIYANLVQALSPHVDIFLCETMSTAAEAVNAATAGVASGKPVYISWTLNETPGAGLRSGESVTDAFNAVAHLPIDSFLFNCTYPEAIPAALQEMKSLTDKPLGCYPNRSNKVDKAWTLDNEIVTGRRTDLTRDYFVAMSKQCIDAGATIVGGCCGIGPDDIMALAEEVA
jgi:S-methylmethionine-dependent homocysteine/selenocysteine methylase